MAHHYINYGVSLNDIEGPDEALATLEKACQITMRNLERRDGNNHMGTTPAFSCHYDLAHDFQKNVSAANLQNEALTCDLGYMLSRQRKAVGVHAHPEVSSIYGKGRRIGEIK